MSPNRINIGSLRSEDRDFASMVPVFDRERVAPHIHIQVQPEIIAAVRAYRHEHGGLPSENWVRVVSRKMFGVGMSRQRAKFALAEGEKE